VAKLLVGAGELLWDLLPSGRRLGGAPANFAFHASRLGCRGTVASRVGPDDLGREATRRLEALGVEHRLQVDPLLPTGTVEVDLDPEGRPAYRIREGVAWDALAFTPDLEALAWSADAVCFGSLGSRDPRARESLARLLGATSGLRVFDVNLRPPFVDEDRIRAFLAWTDVLKLNEDELPRLASIAGTACDPEALRRALGLQAVALTLGERGAVLCAKSGRHEAPGQTVAVVDTVGAGDAFTAALAAGLVQDQDPAVILRRAIHLSAFVCTQAGATPETRDFLGGDPLFVRRPSPD
jgi:fructokinase